MKINTAPNKEHRYKLRSCLNCDGWESCKSGKNRPDGFVCDYGKYGCTRYKGKYFNETPKKKEKKVKP